MKQNTTTVVSAQARQQAAEWFVLLRDGEAGCSTRESFHDWLRKSPENVHAYLRITALWEDSEFLASADSFDRDALLRRAVQSIGDVVEFEAAHPAAGRGLRPNSSARRVGIVAVAASFIIAIAAVTWFQLLRNTYATGIGEQRTITLSDGSTLVLNAQSRTRVHFTKDERDVELLAGQAIFRVAHNPVRAFIVHAGRTRIRAVGTQFDVYRKAASTQVTVIEGRVAVRLGGEAPQLRQTASQPEADTGGAVDSSSELAGRNLPHGSESLGPGSSSNPERPSASQTARVDVPERRDAASKRRNVLEGQSGSLQPDEASRSPSFEAGGQEEILLAAGEQLTVSPNVSAAPKRADIEAATAWTQGKLVFDQTPLSDVVAEFNRYSPRRIIVDDPDLRSLHISGVFPSNDPMGLAELLRQRFNVTVRQSDDEIRIARP